ncbi:MAG: TetR/AcrR family transcriptional regulator [Myxococcota bacterium]
MAKDETSKTRLAMRRQPAQARGRERLEAIVEVAEALMLEKGLTGLKVREIARRSGANIATIYQFFPGRGSITRYIVEKYYRKLGEELEPAFRAADPTDVHASLARLQDAAFHFYADHPVTRELWPGIQGDQSLRARDHEDTQDYVNRVFEFLSRLRPEATDADLDTTAKYIVATSAPLIRAGLDRPEDAPTLLSTHLHAITALVESL